MMDDLFDRARVYIGTSAGDAGHFVRAAEQYISLYARLLEWTEDFLRKKGVEAPRLEAQILLAHVLDCKKIDLYVRHLEEPSEDRRTAFRVGINIGDIIVEGDDIFGDGLDVAARRCERASAASRGSSACPSWQADPSGSAR